MRAARRKSALCAEIRTKHVLVCAHERQQNMRYHRSYRWCVHRLGGRNQTGAAKRWEISPSNLANVLRNWQRMLPCLRGLSSPMWRSVTSISTGELRISCWRNCSRIARFTRFRSTADFTMRFGTAIARRAWPNGFSPSFSASSAKLNLAP